MKSVIKSLAKPSGCFLILGMIIVIMIYPRVFFCGFLPFALLIAIAYRSQKQGSAILPPVHSPHKDQTDLPSQQHRSPIPTDTLSPRAFDTSRSIGPSAEPQPISPQNGSRFVMIQPSSADAGQHPRGEIISYADRAIAQPQQATPRTLSVFTSYETRDTAFRREAQQQRQREGHPVPHVPFMTYWPTYTSLAADQRRWYFYWRTCFRKGTLLETDLSYLFLHVYELLNLVEEPDPRHAADRLWLLWQGYRGQHPKLDNYIPEWGGVMWS